MAVRSPESPVQGRAPSSPLDVDTCPYSQNEEQRLSEVYGAKLRSLHQKVSDLTRLYGESERDAANKLQFWQGKFLSTLQALKDGPSGEEPPQELEQMRERIRDLEHQFSICLDQGEEETGLHTFNRELLSRLKQSLQEKKQLTEELLRLKSCYTNISSGVEECSRQLERMARTSDGIDAIEEELGETRSAVERLEKERTELESFLLQVRDENYELTQGMLSERRDGDQVKRERDRAKRELSELKNQLKGREDELEGRERDNETMVQRLESLRQEIDLLRRAVAARGRSCHEHRQAAPRELDSQNGELTDVRQEMEGLLDELTASRDKLQSYEELLARVREEKTSQAMSESVQVAELEQRLKEAELEIEVCRTQYNENLRKKNQEVENSQRQALNNNHRLTELLEEYAHLQQLHREKSVACEQLEHRVADLNKALQTSLETQEQLVESFQSKQQDIDKLTGQASNLQKQLSKTTGKHIWTKTQLQSVNQQVRNCEEKLKESSMEREKLEREIKLTQERSRGISPPPSISPQEVHTGFYPHQSEEPLGDSLPPHELRSVGVMVNSLPILSSGKKNSPNFSQNYKRALQKGLSQVELGESLSKLRDVEISPDTKLYWVRRCSEMSLQMKESSEYWSAQVKELALQVEQLKQNQPESDTDA